MITRKKKVPSTVNNVVTYEKNWSMKEKEKKGGGRKYRIIIFNFSIDMHVIVNISLKTNTTKALACLRIPEGRTRILLKCMPEYKEK